MKKWKCILLTMLGFILAVSLAMGYIILASHLINIGHLVVGWGLGGIFMLIVIFIAAWCCVNQN